MGSFDEAEAKGIKASDSARSEEFFWRQSSRDSFFEFRPAVREAGRESIRRQKVGELNDSRRPEMKVCRCWRALYCSALLYIA